ncbi:hypothetical protein [Gellertiella hungarica]|uniref:Secreted protein n=1 Tax=Gellertiella hungarica TaxID=1572859 RepID=A0A7W6J4E9_9HYPH|nr:hypothetical protein [Gellertiella hungarica]MBB4064590.1 hypothetical protein [Gellertiella hungarica]
MPRSLLTALIVLPSLALAGGNAESASLCDRLAARLNQMPEIIGSSTSAHYKSESLFRLNRAEIAIRRDMRRLQCPSNSVIVLGDENEQICSALGEELADVRARKQQFQELQPVLSQAVDDGTGMLPAILREMRRAGCDIQGSQRDVEIIGSGSRQASFVEPVSMETQDKAASAEGGATRQDLATILGDNAEADYGTPDPYGMIEIRPGDTPEIEDGKMASVTLPKLEGQDLIESRGSIDTLKTQPVPAPEQPAAALPDRDYNPDDPKVRKIGPSFLAEKDDGIDLTKPEQATSIQ